MKNKTLIFLLLFSIGVQAQTPNNTPTDFVNGIRVPRKDVPAAVQNTSGNLDYFPTTNKLGVHNGTAYQLIATEPWVLGNYAPLSRTLTINGVTFDLSANRTWTIATGVTSFGKVDGYGITSSVANPTTTPVHTVAVDTTQVRSVLNSYTKAQVDAKTVGAFVDLTSAQSVSGNKSWNGTSLFTNLVNINTSSSSSVAFSSNNGTGTSMEFSNTSNTNTSPVVVLSHSNASAPFLRYFGGANSLSFKAATITTPRIQTFQDKDGIVALTSDFYSFENYAASGNGSSTTISIAHGKTGISSVSACIVQARNAASAGISYVTTDATNVNIFYTVAPASGLTNLLYSIQLRP